MDTRQPTDPTPGRDDAHQMPRWVKGFLIAALGAMVLVAVGLAIGSGSHGPSRHLPDSDQSTIQAPEGHTPPVDHG